MRLSKEGLFSYEWETDELAKLREQLDNTAARLGFDLNVLMNSGGEISLFKHLLAAADTSEHAEAFKVCRKVAKHAGKLLACELSIGQPFFGQTVSLVGFSMGCQVLKTCLKTLH